MADRSAPSAAKALAPFFTAAATLDEQLHDAATAINASGPPWQTVSDEVMSKVRTADLAPVATAIPAGLPPDLLRSVILVYSDLASRRSHNARERHRLQLESVIRSLESLPSGSTERMAGVLPTMVLLGHPRIAIRVLEPAWNQGTVDPGTATWVIDQVLFASDTVDGTLATGTAVNEAAVLLVNHAEHLTGAAPRTYSFPGHLMETWSPARALPRSVKRPAPWITGWVGPQRSRRAQRPLWTDRNPRSRP